MFHYQIKASDLEQSKNEIMAHLNSLAYPIESYLEQILFDSTISSLLCDGQCIGYTALSEETMAFFYVQTAHFKHAPALFELVVNQNNIKRVRFVTQDALMMALLIPWDYEVEREGWVFTDVKVMMPALTHSFRTAGRDDAWRIKDTVGDFFDEPGNGFETLEQRIDAETIFLMEDGTQLLGCGVVEVSRLYDACVSIGMFVSREHRHKGVARDILIRLKAWSYERGLTPVAGCWYYNTISRKSLESAGLAAVSMLCEATLKGKEVLPLRTGNPPGELVEE